MKGNVKKLFAPSALRSKISKLQIFLFLIDFTFVIIRSKTLLNAYIFHLGVEKSAKNLFTPFLTLGVKI